MNWHESEPGAGDVLWEPTPERQAAARISRYMEWLQETEGLSFGSYEELWRWSVDDLDAFWKSIWDYFGVEGPPGTGPVHEGRMPDVRWFPGGSLNYARHALRRRDDHLAVVFRSEHGEQRAITYAELGSEVARVAAGLRGLGVGLGDRVAAYVPNIPEALIAMLATASIGAIWSSCSPDFGAPSVIDRFQQIEPKVLIAADGYRYGGKAHDRTEALRRIEADLPTVTTAVVIPYLSPEPSLDGLRGTGLSWADLRSMAPAATVPEFEEVPFGHPLWVLYSSGTTGLPKPIVHSQGGILLEHLKALTFHNDLGPEDVFLWFTTTGWMMWNYLAGGLLVGATVVLYDGSPGHPDMTTLWRIAEETGVTFFGTSAPFLMACRKAGLEPGKQFRLDRVRGIGSTGSPLPPEGFEWVYEKVSGSVLLGSLSGGTDVCTGFVGPCPLLPVRDGEISGRCLGAKVEAFDPDGRPLIGEVGELVVTEAMPSMPIGFWNDPDGIRYRDSYFDVYPGVWRHGDWITINRDGSCVIHGRSDSTLNRGGVRMGTSEFYRVVEALPEIADSLVIDTGRIGAEGRLLLFVVPAEGHRLDGDLTARLRSMLRAELSPRHVPDEIHEVSRIPRTLSGKKLEVPIKKIIAGASLERAVNIDAVDDPEALRHFTRFAAPA